MQSGVSKIPTISGVIFSFITVLAIPISVVSSIWLLNDVVTSSAIFPQKIAEIINLQNKVILKL